MLLSCSSKVKKAEEQVWVLMIRVSDIQRMFNVKIRPVCHDKIKGLARKAWRRAQQSTPVFLPAESHGQRSLAGYV